MINQQWSREGVESWKTEGSKCGQKEFQDFSSSSDSIHEWRNECEKLSITKTFRVSWWDEFFRFSHPQNCELWVFHAVSEATMMILLGFLVRKSRKTDEGDELGKDLRKTIKFLLASVKTKLKSENNKEKKNGQLIMHEECFWDEWSDSSETEPDQTRSTEEGGNEHFPFAKFSAESERRANKNSEERKPDKI